MTCAGNRMNNVRKWSRRREYRIAYPQMNSMRNRRIKGLNQHLCCEFFILLGVSTLKSRSTLALLLSLFTSSSYYIQCICGEFYKEHAGHDDKGFRQTVGGRMQRGASRRARSQGSMCEMHITFIGREIV